MAYKRIALNLTIDEMNALQEAAKRDYRRPRDHAKYLLLTALGQIPERPGSPPIRTKRNAAGKSLATTPSGKAAT